VREVHHPEMVLAAETIPNLSTPQEEPEEDTN
jgi:hypothetical protein